jgi:type IV pilus assembly protein PilM
MGFFSPEGKNLVGVDIGSAMVKVVQLKEIKKGMSLVKFGIEPLPRETIVDGALMNPSNVVETLLKIFHDNKIKEKKVALGVSGHSVIIKRISVDMMSSEELEEHMQWEASQHIPFDISDVEVDYQIIKKDPEKGSLEVILVGVKRTEIIDYAEVAREANLKPLVVDVNAFSIQNQFEMNYDPPSEGEVIVLINIGASITTINVIYKEMLAFTRDIANAGNTITNEIQKRLGISFEEAERLKCGSEEIESKEVVLKEVEDIIREMSESLVSEIQRSLDFYLSSVEVGGPSKIYLGGGTSKISFIKKALAARIEAPIELMDPFRRVMYDERLFNPEMVQKYTPEFSVCVGLGLRKERERVL